MIPFQKSMIQGHLGSLHRLDSTSSNSSCGSAEYPGEATPNRSTSFFLVSPLSHSWPSCWSPQNTQNIPRPPVAQSPVTQL
ncbi:unnamed protein product [Nyctereutes procyonoides]|uniref:(raccoon dog) hypothetical protein n=1 Tax=Nyctereutes procyonoides TaxID=34880 RepID=A0A811Z586_NYCPR|nr:unnamed protein product [Nyctereutes procyonoides]